MKEFRYKTGGRRLYNEDIDRLQALALSMTKIFEDCGVNFVISGCETTINSNNENDTRIDVSVSDGYVWLDGKIREVAPTTITNAPQSYVVAIKVSDTANDTMIRYADGSSGPAYYDYGTLVVTSAEDDLEGVSCIIYDAEKEQFPNLETFLSTYAVGLHDEAWTNLKNNALTKNGGQLYNSATLKLTHGNNDGDETYTSIAPHLIKMQNGDYTETTEIDGRGIRTTGDIKASKLECDSLVILSEETDDNGNRVFFETELKLSTINDAYKYYKNLDAKVISEVQKAVKEKEISTAIPEDTARQIEETSDNLTQLTENYESLAEELAALKARVDAFAKVVSVSSRLPASIKTNAEQYENNTTESGTNEAIEATGTTGPRL